MSILPINTLPKKFGLLLYEGFEVLDVFGPLEALNVISFPKFIHHIDGITLKIIAEEIGLIAAGPAPDGVSISQKVMAEYSIRGVTDLDVLIIPGGQPKLSVEVLSWIANIFPRLQYLFTVCTGSHVAAQAGILNGITATSNKASWHKLSDPANTWATATYWVANARWQVHNNIWTTSGVSAGTDGFIAWIKAIYGENVGVECCKWMEYNAEVNPECDPFAEGLTDIPPTNHEIKKIK